MKAIIRILSVLLSLCNLVHGQTRTIYGRVIDEYDGFQIPGVTIRATGNLLLGKTDMDGRFKVDMPKNEQTLLFGYLAYEPAIIKLNGDCDTVEVIMLSEATYDFMSPKKIDKDRLKRFNKLSELHLQAYKKGLFTKQSICYSREFEPEKPKLDSIEKEEVKIRRQIKLTFEKLNVGDTVKVPFSDATGYRADGTDRTTLSYYSIFADMKHYSCVVTCIILNKNKRKRGYNLICKVIDCGNCKDPSIFRGIVIKPGDVFEYNMKYFKIFDQ